MGITTSPRSCLLVPSLLPGLRVHPPGGGRGPGWSCPSFLCSTTTPPPTHTPALWLLQTGLWPWPKGPHPRLRQTALLWRETGGPVLNPVQFDQLCCSDHIPRNLRRSLEPAAADQALTTFASFPILITFEGGTSSPFAGTITPPGDSSCEGDPGLNIVL